MELLRQFEELKEENGKKDVEIEGLKKHITLQERMIGEMRTFIISNDIEAMLIPEEKDRLNEEPEINEPTLDEGN